MKNLFSPNSKWYFNAIFVAILSATVFFACKEQNVPQQEQQTEFGQLKPIIPDGFPNEILTFKENDFIKVMEYSLSRYRIQGVQKCKFDKLEKLYKEILPKYPNLNDINKAEMAKIKKYFPKDNESQIMSNMITVYDYFEKLIAYDLSTNIEKTYTNDSGYRLIANDNYDALNECEKNFIILHNRMIDGIKIAKTNAENITANKFPNTDTYGRYQNDTDAFRHGILTALIAKYGGKYYGEVSKAVNLAIEFTDKHEDCDTNPVPQIDHDMDKHNNRVGAAYFRTAGYRVKVSCFLGICNYNVSGPDDNKIADELFLKREYKKKKTSAEIIATAENIFTYVRSWKRTKAHK